MDGSMDEALVLVVGAAATSRGSLTGDLAESGGCSDIAKSFLSGAGEFAPRDNVTGGELVKEDRADAVGGGTVEELGSWVVVAVVAVDGDGCSCRWRDCMTRYRLPLVS